MIYHNTVFNQPRLTVFLQKCCMLFIKEVMYFSFGFNVVRALSPYFLNKISTCLEGCVTVSINGKYLKK